MLHAALKKLFILAGGFSGVDGGWRVTITGAHCPNKMVHSDWTPVHPVVDVAVIEVPHDAPSRAPRASITYLWIFEGAYE